MPSLPPTEARVPLHSPRGTNKRIQEAAIGRLRQRTNSGREELEGAIRKLEREWDMERTLEFNASLAAGSGLALGMNGFPAWLWLSVGVLAFLFQHASQGWCPPMPVFRYFGVRTAEEIQDEITALRVLRGDFDFVGAKSGGTSPREDLVQHMVGNKQRSGAFVGASAAAAAAAQPTASASTAKEE